MSNLPATILSAQSDPLDRLKALVLDSVNSPESKRAYGKGISDFMTWYKSTAPGTGFTKATVQGYRPHLVGLGLAASTINVRMSAIRRLAAEAADNGLIDPNIASGVGRVKGIKREGVRTENWLTVHQTEKLINTPDTGTLKGKRDRALLAVLIGCGLRRDEAATLTVEHVQQRDARWVIVDMKGKGGRVRTVPMPSWTKMAIDEWMAAAGFISGRVFRRVNKGDRLCGDSMAAQSIFEVVKSMRTRSASATSPRTTSEEHSQSWHTRDERHWSKFNFHSDTLRFRPPNATLVFARTRQMRFAIT